MYPYIGMGAHIGVWAGVCEYIQACVGVRRHMWAHVIICGCIYGRTYAGGCGHVYMCICVHICIYVGMHM